MISRCSRAAHQRWCNDSRPLPCEPWELSPGPDARQPTPASPPKHSGDMRCHCPPRCCRLEPQQHNNVTGHHTSGHRAASSARCASMALVIESRSQQGQGRWHALQEAVALGPASHTPETTAASMFSATDLRCRHQEYACPKSRQQTCCQDVCWLLVTGDVAPSPQAIPREHSLMSTDVGSVDMPTQQVCPPFPPFCWPQAQASGVWRV